MMGDVERDDELAEIDLTEDEVDAMMAAGEPVDVIGPPSSRRRVTFEIVAETARRGYRWRITSTEGRVLATSSVHPTKKQAIVEARAVVRASVDADVVDGTAFALG